VELYIIYHDDGDPSFCSNSSINRECSGWHCLVSVAFSVSCLFKYLLVPYSCHPFCLPTRRSKQSTPFCWRCENRRTKIVRTTAAAHQWASGPGPLTNSNSLFGLGFAWVMQAKWNPIVSSAMGVGESFYFYLIQQLSATNTFAYNDTKKTSNDYANNSRKIYTFSENWHSLCLFQGLLSRACM